MFFIIKTTETLIIVRIKINKTKVVLMQLIVKGGTFMGNNIFEGISANVNMYSNPSELKITDVRITNIDGAPKHCLLVKIYTNQDIVGYGEVRDSSSATYVLMLKSRLIGENPCNVDKLFRRIKQFGGHSRQGGGTSGIEIALWD